jgi:hypothetical protein
LRYREEIVAKNFKQVMGEIARYVAALPWGEEEPDESLIQVDLKVDRQIHAHVQIGRISATEQKKARATLSQFLPTAAVDELLKSEDRLFNWFKKNPENAARFHLDPVGALAQAGVKLPPRTLDLLARHREGQKRSKHPSGVQELASLKIEAVEHDEPKS